MQVGIIGDHIQFNNATNEPNIGGCPLLFLLGLNSSLDLHQ
jgi:hypothetical protein